MRITLETAKPECLDMAERIERPMQGCKIEVTIDRMLAVEGASLCPVRVGSEKDPQGNIVEFVGCKCGLDCTEQGPVSEFVRGCADVVEGDETGKFEISGEGILFLPTGEIFLIIFEPTHVPAYLFPDTHIPHGSQHDGEGAAPPAV